MFDRYQILSKVMDQVEPRHNNHSIMHRKRPQIFTKTQIWTIHEYQERTITSRMRLQGGLWQIPCEGFVDKILC